MFFSKRVGEEPGFEGQIIPFTHSMLAETIRVNIKRYRIFNLIR